MLRRHYSNATAIISELSWIFLYVRVCMYVMFVSIWWDLFFLLHLFTISSSCFSLTLLFLFFWLVMLSRVFLLLSLVCSRTMIIVIREIYKFDDRPDNDASVQVYYRLSMRMQDTSAKTSQSRLASSRDNATVDCGIPNRNVFLCICACIHHLLLFFFMSLSFFIWSLIVFYISCSILVTFRRIFRIIIYRIMIMTVSWVSRDENVVNTCAFLSINA